MPCLSIHNLADYFIGISKKLVSSTSWKVIEFFNPSALSCNIQLHQLVILKSIIYIRFLAYYNCSPLG